jgi:uncharacterized oxidoreductase
MKTTGNTVLITGGATGIGFSLAQAFSEAGNRVIICGRREEKLREAKAKLPDLEVIICDVAKPERRRVLRDWTTATFPDLNMIVNNAGIQRQIDLRQGLAGLVGGENEITVNLEAPIYLSALFIPHLLKKPEAAIVNITSGLAFTPLSAVPVYCATKAALHSFSLSLRHQLAGTAIKVFEVAPPIVNTDLDQGAREERGQEDRGIAPQEVAKETLQGLRDDRFEIVIGLADNLRQKPDKMFGILNR